jgi:monoamine oxidase
MGGRVITFKDLVKDKIVEGGGELTGPNQATWMAYGKKFGFEFFPVVPDNQAESPVILDGKRLDRKAAKELWEEMEGSYGGITEAAAAVDPEQPWKAPKAAELDWRTLAQWIDELKVSPHCKRALALEFETVDGMDPAWQSYLGNLAVIKGGGLARYWTDTDTLRCKGGNSQMAEKLAAGIGRDNVLLGTPVTDIRITDRLAAVTTADGKTREADEVILAIPPSTWGRVRFDPPLPATLRPQMARNLKFLAVVKSRFWKKAGLFSRSLTDGPVGLTWEATNNQPGEEEAALVLFSGDRGGDTCRSWSPEDRVVNYLREVDRLFPGIVQEYERGRFMDWLNDPYTRGSYAFPAPGEVCVAGPVLYEGIGRLRFAGEHCSYAFTGYMEGALNAGVALAKRMAKRDGLLKGT